MGIRNRIGRALLGEEIDRVERAFGLLREAYVDGPYRLPPDELVRQLSEYDSAILQDLVTQLNYDVIGGLSGALDHDAERTRSVEEARLLYRYDVLTEWAVHTWTNYGFGENVEIRPVDEAAQKTWKEFWTADRNGRVLAADELHELSETVLVDGELFLAFYASTLDGEATVRPIDTKEIAEIVTDPDDGKAKLFYKRQWVDDKGTQKTMYYPDWRAFFDGTLDRQQAGEDGGLGKTLAERVLPRGADRADQQNGATTVIMLHIAHNRKRGVRGWPITATAAPWSRTHKRFREDRASVAAALAMYVQKIKVKGGSRAVDAVRARLQSALTSTEYVDNNPPAAPGSTWIENDAAELQRLSMGSGASDAKIDGESLFLMACLGLGLFPHYAGAGDAYRLATATAMEKPLEMQWSRYQLFWSAQFRKIVRIVLQFKEKYSNARYGTYDAEVSTDRLVEVDLGAISQSLTALFRDALTPYVELGILPDDVAKQIIAATWRIVLQAVGVADATKVLSDDALGIEPEPAAEREPEETGLMESHLAEEVRRVCPFDDCDSLVALAYPDHKGLLVCAKCARTFDPEVE